MTPTASILVVNFNGESLLPACLDSLQIMHLDNLCIEVIVVDNRSTDNSLSMLREQFPDVRIISNDVNNYAKAVNLGIDNSNSDYIVLLNNDASVAPDFLKTLLACAKNNPHVGAVQSKILFSDGIRINSVGVEQVEDFYFRDSGFGEKDKGQYDETKEIDYFCGGAVLLRRECLSDVGAFDEDFIMYMEDVDYSIRMKNSGWKILYTPDSVVYHKYQGSASSQLCAYLCSRNRLLCLAKHYPDRLPVSLKTSHFYRKGEFDNLYSALLQAVRSLVKCRGVDAAVKLLGDMGSAVADTIGFEKAYQLLNHIELFLGLRKLRVGIYDHAFHFAGGGQRYVAEIANILQDDYEVTYIVNKDIKLDQYQEWFNIDLSKCSLKVVKIPFYEQRNEQFINERKVIWEKVNPFELISKESRDYDVFINSNMLTKVRPRTPRSLFICHFPDQDREKFFHVEDYDYLVSNSSYTSFWIRRRWKLNATHLLYPPVDMQHPQADPIQKEKFILSVARFEKGGSKKQIELVKAFDALVTEHPDTCGGWRLVLAGGTFHGNAYLEELRRIVESSSGNIELKPNAGYEELKDLYRRAAIFWHACGLNEVNPILIEHFGMTTVEAMQNYCLPIVIDGGGQREIVEHGVHGYRFKNVDELKSVTEGVIRNDKLRLEMSRRACLRSQEFTLESFRNSVRSLFSTVENELTGVDAL